MKRQPNMRKILSILALVLAIISLFSIVTPVFAAPIPQTITLLSGGTTQTAGFTLINPFPQQLDPTLYSGAGTWFTAPVITNQPAPWVQSPPAQWVSTTSAFSGDDGDYPGDSWRLFKDQFTIPSGVNITTATINIISADNAFELYFNGNLIDDTTNWVPSATVYGPSPVPFGPATPYTNTVSYNITPQIGVNTFMFVVRNWALTAGNNPTGLLYSASITYEPSEAVAVGGPVYRIDKFQLMLPWFGIGLGILLAISLAVKGSFFRRK